MSSVERLDDVIARLERAAEQLRSGELSADAAATLVEDCANLASQAAVELEQAAEQLRGGELDSAAAADLIERCAELAARLGSELEALARKGEGASPGQETLL